MDICVSKIALEWAQLYPRDDRTLYHPYVENAEAIEWARIWPQDHAIMRDRVTDMRVMCEWASVFNDEVMRSRIPEYVWDAWIHWQRCCQST